MRHKTDPVMYCFLDGFKEHKYMHTFVIITHVIQNIRKIKSSHKSKKKQPVAASKILEIPNCYITMKINKPQPREYNNS